MVREVRVTTKQVATEAGVSTQVVSRVLVPGPEQSHRHHRVSVQASHADP
jgi:hypothetical protein